MFTSFSTKSLSSIVQLILLATQLYPSTASPSNIQTPLTPSISTEPTNTTAALLALHSSLISIESISGNENEVGAYIEKVLVSLNYTVKPQIVAPIENTPDNADRYNIYAYKGSSPSTPVLITSHMDTVPPFIPYHINATDGSIWGRGSVDAKACAAAQITAVESLLHSNQISKDDVSLLFVVGEEIGGDGMRAVNDLGLSWKTVIFGEPTELKLASGHKGNVAFRLIAHGKAGHSGYPWLGENANDMLIPALAVLKTAEFPSSEKYGNTTVNIGRMEGGVAANVIAEKASAQILMRLAGGTAEDARKIVQDTIWGVDKRIEIIFPSNGYGPIDIDHDVEGFESMTVNYGTDIPQLEGTHKRYLYGPGSILVAHSDHESIAPEDLVKSVEGYKKLILAALKN
ncbi:hypothetical protein MMC25_004590 [Agyrium rufum]|nr:hypothetical protein [Agyrium rufum]